MYKSMDCLFRFIPFHALILASKEPHLCHLKPTTVCSGSVKDK